MSPSLVLILLLSWWR